MQERDTMLPDNRFFDSCYMKSCQIKIRIRLKCISRIIPGELLDVMAFKNEISCTFFNNLIFKFV